ncbi:TonB-dependent receptor [Sphingopyxis sp. J-6]|uniref:TonB-dependent receptor n=1 Tax=Sphingopyxis sp. J-6 TaxID=3122054 RepID=UPI0039843497
MATVSALALLPGVAAAQSTIQSSAGQPSSGEASGDAEIVVTALRNEQTLGTVPLGISAISAEKLEERAAKSMADFVALTPGLNLQSIGAAGNGVVAIRGISPQAVAGTVATYIDEVPISSSGIGARGGLYQPDLDPNDIERVEVLKGPQGTLYGASSLGGVIKYVLKKPSLTETDIHLSEGLTMFDNGEPGIALRASATTPLITDKLGVRVSAFYRHDPGFVDDVLLGGRNVNDANAWGVRGGLYWKPVDNVSVDLSAMIQQTNSQGFSTVDLDWQTFEPLYGKDTQLRAVPEYLKVRTEFYSATLKWDTGAGTLLSSTGYAYVAPRDQGDMTYNYTGTGGPIEYGTPGAARGSHINKQFSQEIRFSSNRFGPVEFTVGGFFQRAKTDDRYDYLTFTEGGVVDPNAPLLGQNYASGVGKEYAGFINGNLYLTEQFDISAGYRYSHIEQTRSSVRGGAFLYGVPPFSLTDSRSTEENKSTYQIGARWRPSDDLMFYVRAASGYRPGGTRGVPPTAPPGTSPSYTSDTIWSYEAGMKVKALDGRLTFDADVYRIDWSDIQTLVYFGFFNTVGNGGKARSEGGEIQATFEPVKGLTLTANGGYTNARFTEDAPEVAVTKGLPIYYVPKWTATFGADYGWELANGLRANIGGDYAYRSSQLDATRFRLPGYSILNLRAGVKGDSFGVNLYVKNVTDKRALVGTSQGYYEFFNPFVVVVNEPRSYGITLTQNF